MRKETDKEKEAKKHLNQRQIRFVSPTRQTSFGRLYRQSTPYNISVSIKIIIVRYYHIFLRFYLVI